MALFGSSKKTEETQVKEEVEVKKEVASTPKVEAPDINTSRLQYGVKVEGDIDARGSLILGGDFKGKAVVEDTMVIEHNATFNGELKAKNVKIAGVFEGKVEAVSIEVTKTARFKGLINATKTFLAGEVKAIIKSSDSLEVLPTGVVETKEAKSNNIKILGKLYGRVIASELLEVTEGGSIEGTIVTKGIKTEQGGTIIGNIQTFDESVHGIDIEYTLEDVLEDEDNLEVTSFSNLDKLSKEDLKKYAKKEPSPKEEKKESE